MPTPWSAEDDKTLLKAVQEYQDRGKKLNWVAIHEVHLSHMDFKQRKHPNKVLREHYATWKTWAASVLFRNSRSGRLAPSASISFLKSAALHLSERHMRSSSQAGLLSAPRSPSAMGLERAAGSGRDSLRDG